MALLAIFLQSPYEGRTHYHGWGPKKHTALSGRKVALFYMMINSENGLPEDIIQNMCWCMVKIGDLDLTNLQHS